MDNYLDTDYQPKPTELTCIFRAQPNRVSLAEAARAIAGESSIGTWTEVTSLHRAAMERLKPTVFYCKDNIIKIAYPLELFEPGNISQIMSSIAGNIFGMGVVKSIKLEDIHLPQEVIRHYKGPRFGIAGIRKLMKVPNRPFVGTIIKPKVGLGPEDHALVAFESWIGGCDFVKDDENLTDQPFNRFEKRIKLTLKQRDRAESRTGERKMYFANVTAETKEMIRRAKFVKKQGGEYIMVDILTTGWSGLATLIDEDLGLVIHGHRAGHAAFTRNREHGISMLVIAKLHRLLGVDQLHIGSILGKMEGSRAEVQEIEEEIEESYVHRIRNEVLEQEWGKIKPVMAVASGGLHPGLVPGVVRYFGHNVVIQAGGGIHGHPAGTIVGAAAMRQAVDAAVGRIPLSLYSAGHPALKAALEKWPVKSGYKY